MDTTQLRDAYERDGHGIVRGAIPAEACARMADRLWKALASAHGIRRDAPDPWTPAMPRGLQGLCRADGFRDVAAPALLEAVDAIVGHGT